MNELIEPETNVSRRRTNSRLEVYIEVPTGTAVYARSNQWRKRVLVLAIITAVLSVAYTIMTVALTIVYGQAHTILWIFNIFSSVVALVTSGLGIAGSLAVVKRALQFKLSVAFCIGLFIFLSMQLCIGLAAPRIDCLYKNKKSSVTDDDDPILDVCTMAIEAIIVYTTIGVSIVLFTALWFSVFVRLRIMKQEDKLTEVVRPTIPTPTTMEAVAHGTPVPPEDE
jgi:hypothetical protein